ncbi:MAG: hypothetical protein N3D82_04165 [Ignisphaera sp.]|nr:hypothetical protein [Ignisphaera sp.]MCX8168203.1 hypothetical protein [Ignisphaera sp.]MDW8084927.1 hypothetical protein [Ignisphaera sp.]
MRSSTEAVLEYLIVKILAGRDDIVRAVHDYFVNSVSPSSVATKYNLSKHQVRGYIQRIVEKTGSVVKARVLLKYAIPVVLKIKPVTREVNGYIVKCGICGEELPSQIMEDHIRKRHASLIDEYLESTVEIIKKSVTLNHNS